jgi:hypothetical protein
LVAQDSLMSSQMMCFHDSTTSPATIHEDHIALQILEETTLQPVGNSSCNEENPMVPATTANEAVLLADEPITEILPPTSSSPRQNMVHANQRRLKQSRMAAMQSSCYVFSALFLAIWTLIPWIGHKLQVEAPVRFFFAFMTNAVGPAQGFLNLLIFVRLQYLHIREREKNNWGRLRCFRECLFSSA